MMTSTEKTELVAVMRAVASISVQQAEARRLDAEAHVDRCKKAWHEEQEHVRLDRQRADLPEASI